MKFFIPHAETTNVAEERYKAIKAFAKDNLGWNVSNRKIYRIGHFDTGEDHIAKVGKVTETNNEEALAILESNAYLVCAPNRGFL